ncbi:class II fructose-bisphosphate aldolase [Marivita sp.]|uniref:class II fructose-bisphosphate aldolase n=1 Tax=Marivita sp. TaxID=2003365 RepID=UPI0032191F0E
MMLVAMRTILDHAAERGYGVPAFNITNMETLQGVMTAAYNSDSPVILQATRSARAYMGDVMLRHMLNAVLETWPTVPVAMHQDHGNNFVTCQTAIDLGFSSVMMDGSLEEDGKTPASFDYNVRTTASVVGAAHAVGVSVEGELGVLGSLETGAAEPEDGHGFEGTLEKHNLVTDPADAARFVAETDVDALAIAIGTSHGAYKFSRKPTNEILAMETLKEIHRRLPSTHLVMHGASTVPQDLQDMINEFGGVIPQTFGVPLEEVELGIKYGVRKINIDTDIRMAMTGTIRRHFAEKPASFDIRGYLKTAAKATEALCRERYERFGSAGNGSKIPQITLADMAARYSSGSLAQRLA